jgi:methylmalonyl-CoA/ethylmalonyl-CoA epimerase
MLRFHHLGIATKSLGDDARAYSRLGYAPEGSEFADEWQGVRGLFLNGGGPRLELLEPLAGSDTLTPILNRGVKCYHHAYEVSDMEASLSALEESRARVIRPAAPAVAFEGRRVVFLMLPNMWMVELIDADLGETAETSGR